MTVSDPSLVVRRNAPEVPDAASDPNAMALLIRHPTGLVGLVGTVLVVSVGVAAPWLAPNKPFAIVAPPLAAPSSAFRMGSDALGHDIASQVVHGARSSLTIAAVVSVLVLVIGTTIGLVAGSSRSWVDDGNPMTSLKEAP